MGKDIISLIQNEECPLINALFLSNGEMYVLESQMGDNPIIRVLCKSSIESYFEFNDTDYITSFDVHQNIETEAFIISIGEGAFGGDGIVYLTNRDTESLMWFLFLDNSNPFDSAKIENNNVIVKSTKNLSYSIPIFQPELISLLP